MSFDGIILVDKEPGWTSFDVVAKIRGILRTEIRNSKSEDSSTALPPNSKSSTPKIKVGHTGTLDPLAAGLMIVVVGKYCKRASEFSKMDKVYEVQMKLGETSTTGDEEGIKTKVESIKFKEEDIVNAFHGFLGESMQVPPAFSAIKINGQRAYDLARKGLEVKLEPRKITIYDIKITKYDFPYINFTVNVSSGTYIRSLVEDIAKVLNTGAYMTKLTRTVVGQYDIKNAHKLPNISSASIIEAS